MAMRSVPSCSINRVRGLMEINKSMKMRYLSDDKGRIFSEEERAKETVYIQKMERERMEKLKKKKKVEQQKIENDKAAETKGAEEAHTS